MNMLTMRTVRDAGGMVRHAPAIFLPAAPTKRGKKARPVPDPIQTNGEGAAEEVRLLLERLERLHEEKRGIADDIRDVEAEAKGRGYSAAALNAIRKIRLKAKEEYQEETAILELYMQNLGML
jgi:uncharacterized protein (UPF0335 family)